MQFSGSNRRKVAAALLWLALLAPEDVVAQNRADVIRVVFVTGTCERLMVLEAETANCRGRVVNIYYDNGRSSFAFTSDVGVISFSGFDLVEQGEELELLVDRVTAALRDADAVPVEAARGLCTFADFGAGPARITCAARSASGDFAGIFAADGRPLQIEDFGGD